MEKPFKKDSENDLSEEIKSIFIEIENKITALNQCSYDDFILFNDKLNNNLSLSSIISENLDELFELSGKDGNKKLIESILDDFNVLKSQIFDLEKVIETSIRELDALMTELNLIPVPLNNFNQNLSSLHLLLANLKLITTCGTKSLKGFGVDDSVYIEKVIDKVKDVCPVVEENIYGLINHLKSLQKELYELKKNELNSLFETADLTFYDFISTLDQINNGLNERYNIAKKTKNYYNDTKSIMSVLQYQNDIKRKVECFHSTNNSLLKELVKIECKNSNNNKLSKNQQISQIADDQISRILSINHEYQQTVEKISSGMINSRNEINNILSQSKFLSSVPANSIKDSERNSFEIFTNKLSRLLTVYNKFTEEISLVQKVVKELNDKYDDAEMMERAIEQKIVDKILIEDFLVRPDPEVAQQAQKIYKIYSDNHFEKNKIKQKFDGIIESINSIIKANAVFSFKNGSIHHFESLLDNSKQKFEKLNSNTLLIENKYRETTRNGEEIVENVNQAVEQIKYYQFFEKTVKEVVSLLEQINRKIKPHALAANNEAINSKDTAEFEANYLLSK